MFRTFCANWVIPVEGPPIPNGMVVSDQQHIISVGEFRDGEAVGEVIKLGKGAIIPGLVNAHTHLEFSDIATPLGEPGMSFTDWIRLVVESRMRPDGKSTKTEAIRKGISESFESGAWVIGEIATLGPNEESIAPDAYKPRHPHQLILPFLEQLGRDPSTFADKQNQLDRHLSAPKQHASPHAPYSTHPKLVSQICQQVKSCSRMTAMHLAETQAELELLDRKTGEFVDMLKAFLVWDEQSFDQANSISALLSALATCPRSLIIHGNYLNAAQIQLIRNNKHKMSVVFCPRTHRYFEHSEYPLTKFIENQINVALGTDSRASNPDLSLFEEIKLTANLFNLPKLSALDMGTRNGAESLGVINEYGTLEPGKLAAMSFVSNPSCDTSEAPETWLFRDESTCKPIV